MVFAKNVGGREGGGKVGGGKRMVHERAARRG